MKTRIVSFLGLSNRETPPYYDEVPYEIEVFSGGQRVRTAKTALKDVATVLATEDNNCSLLMLGTEQAKNRWFGQEGAFRLELQKGLAASPGGLSRNPMLGFQSIPEGTTREECWRIFTTLNHALQAEPLELSIPGDTTTQRESQEPTEIVLDITHGFRSAPFFAASVVAFQRSEQRRKGQNGPRFRIVYAHHEPWKYKEDPDGYTAPIWFLDDLIEVLDWNTAIDDLMRHGRADELERRVQAVHNRAARHARENQLNFPKLQQFGKAARDFADSLVTARIPETITERSEALKNAIASCRQDLVRHIPPLEPQLDHLQEKARALSAPTVVSREGIRASLELATLYLELQRYAEAAITLRETVVSACSVELTGNQALQPHHGGTSTRVRGNSGFQEERKHHEDHLWTDSAEDTEVVKQLRNLMRSIGDLRNDVEHGGFREMARGGSNIRGELQEKLNQFRKLSLSNTSNFASRGGVFLNLSNHPVSTWSQEQREAARALGLGEPADLEGGMPLVPPEADAGTVQALAQELAQRAAEQGARGAHVAGEFTLTLALVRALQTQGVRCFAATTRRDVEERPGADGGTEKAARFRFVRWREYL
ncbi:MAG: TM1812 family CRISPR-associated protein [Myxococcales bacterium]|nr:TM1812 family CRISPR-associated protein [Polyangiaceae bacterium]MDW8250197.1 TM1812 family CRISPR-associated protein [Myxococcales bacterium]